MAGDHQRDSSRRLAAVRQQLLSAPLQRADLAAHPVDQFAAWYEQAQQAALPQPHAMTLATANNQGVVSSRLVLLRTFDQDGFVFFTGLETQKAQDIATNDRVALLFPWLLLERQVRVQGTAVPLSTAAALRFFLTRRRGSQLGAWLTQTEGVVTSRAVLQAKWAELKRRFQDDRIPLPTAWGGYRVVPRRVEFWQGRAHGLHDRFVYAGTTAGAWDVQRLLP